MHPTKQHILSVLKQQSPRRYRDLIPADLDGNTFMHHLRAVMDDGFVAHREDHYELTLSGKRLVDSWSSTTLAPSPQPKVMVEVVYRNPEGEWLLVEQLNEPFRGRVGFPCGRLHIGERLEEAAHRELREQSGLTADNLAYYGCLTMETQVDGATISHLLTHVFKANVVAGNLIEKSLVGRPFYSALESLKPGQPFQGITTVIKRLNSTPQDLADEVFIEE